MSSSASTRVRHIVREIPPLRSAYYLWQVLNQMVANKWQRRDTYESVFATSRNPWNYHLQPAQQRFLTALSLLDRISREPFPHALELGCAEGYFTAHLAGRCHNLVAADFSAAALSRARARLHGLENVSLIRLDLREDELGGRFSLVTAMDILCDFLRPWELCRAKDKIVEGIAPGGILLFCGMRQSFVFETAWWGRFTLRGGGRIRELLTRDARLQLLASAEDESHVFAIYRRTPLS